MPLHTRKAGDCRGTETDGSRSEKWCSLCYVDGRFVDPDCSLDEMRGIVDFVLKRDGSARIFRWLARRQIPSLERWQSHA